MYDTKTGLIAQTFTINEIGVQVPAETLRYIWAEVESVQRSEWNAAGMAGINPEARLVTPSVNYRGERIAVLNGERYGIYRTYDRKNGETELYLQKMQGVTYGD